MNQFNGKRILVIDDEQDILSTLSQRLESVGYNVITADNGQEGLEKARKESPSLIILDLMLPGIDGYQICGILKHDRLYMKIPILILTARTHSKDYELAMNVGADAFMTKPFDAQNLIARIAGLLKIETLTANQLTSGAPSASDSTLDEKTKPTTDDSLPTDSQI